MDIFIAVFLPLTLVVIMFSLGLGLRVEDFRRVVIEPKAFAIGTATQIIVIPLVAFLIATLFRLPPELALGLMILSFCPSGVTSNFLTKLAHGDVALAVSLTGVSSLTAVLTMPILVKFAAEHFLGTAAPDFSVLGLGLQVFTITAIPTIAGILVRHFMEALADRIEKPISNLATVMFVLVVIGALASNWTLFVDNLPRLGPSVVLLNVSLLALGLFLAYLFALNRAQATALSIETGIHNATLGIHVGTIVAAQVTPLPALSFPAGVYGIIMYFIGLAFVFWRRRNAKA